MNDKSNFVLDEGDKKTYLKAKHLKRHVKPTSYAGAEAQQTPKINKKGSHQILSSNHKI
jgi:hypothetical protein